MGVLKRKEKGESVKQMVKEERRKARRELERKKQKPFKFSNQSDADPVEEQSKTKKRKKNKRKAEADGMSGLEGLTGDEKMAVELYQVIKKSRNNKDLEEDDEVDDLGLEENEKDQDNEDENATEHL